MDFKEMVYKTTKKIPKGKVSTYSIIAKAIGKPKSYRAVGNILNKNVSKEVPCHRIVRNSGKVGGFANGTENKIRLLKNEGIVIKNKKIMDFKEVLYKM